MSENDSKDAETGESDTGPGKDSAAGSGPKFEKQPDPLAGVKKAAADVNAKMEGKTVSMRTYVGTIIAVIVLMMLARCGG